jgi:hypothetical protein
MHSVAVRMDPPQLSFDRLTPTKTSHQKSILKVHKSGEALIYTALQRQFRLNIPFLGIARPQPQFPHSCVSGRFIYSQDRSTYFLQQKRQTHRGNI